MKDADWPALRDSIKRDIDGEHRVSLICVISDPVFTYTVGLEPLLGVEVIMFGMPPNMAAALFNDIAHEAQTFGFRLPPDRPDYRWANLPTVFKRCVPQLAREFVKVADRYYGKPVAVMQAVFPDKHGLFPWEAGFDESLRAAQPALWEES